MKKANDRVIEVSHPKHGIHKAQDVRDRLQALQQAAKVWDIPWSKIARECRFREVNQDDLDTEG